MMKEEGTYPARVEETIHTLGEACLLGCIGIVGTVSGSLLPLTGKKCTHSSQQECGPWYESTQGDYAYILRVMSARLPEGDCEDTFSIAADTDKDCSIFLLQQICWCPQGDDHTIRGKSALL